jgi:hypothetical protein
MQALPQLAEDGQKAQQDSLASANSTKRWPTILRVTGDRNLLIASGRDR